MQAVLLLAGYGSRLDRPDLPHKVLLPFGEETLISRHLKYLKALGIDRAFLVLGHNKKALRDYVLELNPGIPVEFIDNELYLTTGNTLSTVLGLRKSTDDVLIMDGDVLYPPSVFLDYVNQSSPSSFAVVPADIHNAECAKVLLNPSGTINAFITKRHLTPEEKNGYRFAGEAIGFFKLSRSDAAKFTALYDRKEKAFAPTLWEIPFSEFAQDVELHPWRISEHNCFEIDTEEDYQYALDQFRQFPELYQ